MMKRLFLALLTVNLLYGCEAVNDTMVRREHQDHRLGYELNEQITEGLRRRMTAPPEAPAHETRPVAPSGLDQG